MTQSGTAVEPIWSPSVERIERANLTAFRRFVAERWDAGVVDYSSLHEFSIRRLGDFYDALWQFFDIVGDKGTDIVIDPERMLETKWFPQARFNFAENYLRRRDDGIAIVARTEDGVRRTLTWNELYDAVSRAAQAFAALGVVSGDRIAACLPNAAEAVIAMLAAASIGAVWSCCATDSSEQLLADRLGQIDPKLLIVADGYSYDGRLFRMCAKTEALARRIPSLERIIVVDSASLGEVPNASCPVIAWNALLARYAPGPIAFRQLPFGHPLWVLYSSGTTGKPKAIIHGAGGSMLQGLKSVVLDMDLHAGERLFVYTSTGWMVWNTMLGGLAWRSPIVLYEGSPLFPTTSALLDIIAEEHVHVVRIVPSIIDAYAKAGLDPAVTHDLGNLKCIASGGAPLLPHHYAYVYSRVKADVHLMSPAGGTDILGSFVTGNPTGPVYPGEIQAASLGLSVEIFDGDGQRLVGQPGELVCTKPFPSMPVGFWGDTGNERYHASYFSMYPGVWRQGDWAEATPRGGFVIYGRADATLNVKGVRIGTSEIYRGLEAVPEVIESVAVAQRHGDDERIILFVKLRATDALDDELRLRIRSAIRAAASARHVPAKIVGVPDLPRSANGKPSEIAVRDAIHGRPVKSGGLSNPGSLEFFRLIPELST